MFKNYIFLKKKLHLKVFQTQKTDLNYFMYIYIRDVFIKEKCTRELNLAMCVTF